MATQNSKKEKELQKAAKSSQREGALYKIRGVFPFDLLPNSLILEKNKVDIIYYRFPFFRKVFSIFYIDVRTVKIQEGIFFATLKFEIKGYEQNPEPVPWLFKSEARKARDLILGMCATEVKEVPVPEEVSKGESKEALEELGEIKHE